MFTWNQYIIQENVCQLGTREFVIWNTIVRIVCQLKDISCNGNGIGDGFHKLFSKQNKSSQRKNMRKL